MAGETEQIAPSAATDAPAAPSVGVTPEVGEAPSLPTAPVEAPGEAMPAAPSPAGGAVSPASPPDLASAATSGTEVAAEGAAANDAPADGSAVAPAETVADPDPWQMPSDTGELLDMASDLSEPALKFLQDGGYTIWAIAALSVITVALILWKIWRLALIGAWSRGWAQQGVTLYEAGQVEQAKAAVAGRRGLRSKVVHAALHAREAYPDAAAREETLRVAKREIGAASGGLRPLELISTIAPLLGLLGTVLGMIAAFQALQEAGTKADPATLAGGIWEALLTTAAGMAVAIPASAALAWFEGILDGMASDVEDAVTRIFLADQQLATPEPEPAPLAAE